LGVALISDAGDRFIRVAHMVPGGPFDIAGVKQEDVIISINGQSVWDQQHQDIVGLLKAADKTVTMEVAKLTSVQDVLKKEKKSPDNDQRSLPLPEHPKGKSYEVIRTENGLGIALESSPSGGQGLLKKILPGGSFDDAGVSEGHIIVQVNDTNLVNGSHPEIVEALKQAGDTFTVIVVPPPSMNVATGFTTQHRRTKTSYRLPLSRDIKSLPKCWSVVTSYHYRSTHRTSRTQI